MQGPDHVSQLIRASEPAQLKQQTDQEKVVKMNTTHFNKYCLIDT